MAGASTNGAAPSANGVSPSSAAQSVDSFAASPTDAPSAPASPEQKVEQKKEKVFRSHDRPPTLSSDDISQKIREQSAAFEDVIKKLDRTLESVVSRIESAAKLQPTPAQEATLEAAVRKDVAAGRLEQKPLPNGNVEYGIPLGSVRGLGYELSRNRTAFVDCKSHINVMGSSETHIKAAVEHAARKWEGGDVRIHAQGSALDKVIEHAVRANLNIVNKEPDVQAKVAAERERQQNPLRRQALVAGAPIIERVGMVYSGGTVKSEGRSV